MESKIARREVALPVEVTADRFFVTPITLEGETLRLYTDSGGGLFMLSSSVERLGLTVTTLGRDQAELTLVALPPFRPEASIPLPLANEGQLPLSTLTQSAIELLGSMDGLLGQAWFSGRVWTWDYPGRRLLWIPDGGMPSVAEAHTIELGFKTDLEGARLLDFPRLAVTVDGQLLDLLFDTGATVKLSPGALEELDDQGPESRGASFIAATHFDNWRRCHPEWRLIEGADRGFNNEPMIEVPSIFIAGHTVGPVWFTRRPDANFHGFMSRWMDKQVEGALGGSALRFFRVTVDYPNGLVAFERCTE
jgi:hypothetical protein